MPRQYGVGKKEFEKVRTVAFSVDGKKQYLYLPKRPDDLPVESVWWIFGGNGSVALDWIDVVASVPDADKQAFVLFDYPGYGMNRGTPGLKSITASIDAAVPKVAEALGLTRDDLIAKSKTLGHSLGAAVALDFTNRYELDRVIAVSPFTTMEAMAKRTMGSGAALLLRDRYDNERSLSDILQSERRVRITIFHGQNDTLIPSTMSQSLAELDSSGRTIELTLVPEAGHNDIIMRIAPALVRMMAE